MNYSKPEVCILGNAKTVIEKINNVKQHTQVGDPSPFLNLPAYDLDE